MLKKLRKFIKENNILEKEEHIVVGVSGGADSVALMLMLCELQGEYGLNLSVVHINHGIRNEAKEDADYVKKLCEAYHLSFQLFEADIPAMAKQQGMTEEEMGRIYRYQCFEQVMQKVGAKKLAVAHHKDDQAETVLFHLIRGSNIAGMEGMRLVAPLPNYAKTNSKVQRYVIRPLLPFRKEELVQWLEEKHITWKEDVTNGENTYSRNMLRNQVIPMLERINSRTVEHIARFGEEMSRYQMFFQKMVDEYVKEYVQVSQSGMCSVNREHLLQQDEVLINGVLYEMLTKACGYKKDIGKIHIADIKELLHNQSGKQIHLPYHMIAENSYEKLIIRKDLQGEWENCEYTFSLLGHMGEEDVYIEIDENRGLYLSLYEKKHCSKEEWENLVGEVISSKNNYTKYFECDKIGDTLSIRTTKDVDSFLMNSKGNRKRVSRYFIDEKIPVEQRKKTLVLAQENNVLWIIGQRRSEDVKVTIQSEKILKVTCEGEW